MEAVSIIVGVVGSIGGGWLGAHLYSKYKAWRTPQAVVKLRPFQQAKRIDLKAVSWPMLSSEDKFCAYSVYECPYCEQGISDTPKLDAETGYLFYRCCACKGEWATMNREQLAEAGQELLLRAVGG